jgi:hypothetical protein
VSDVGIVEVAAAAAAAAASVHVMGHAAMTVVGEEVLLLQSFFGPVDVPTQIRVLSQFLVL